jgi:hypothetical protein
MTIPAYHEFYRAVLDTTKQNLAYYEGLLQNMQRGE